MANDQTTASLTNPAWVPKLTEPTQEVGSGTYVSIHDYNLLIKRADERAMTNIITGVIVGMVVAYALQAMMK